MSSAPAPSQEIKLDHELTHIARTVAGDHGVTVRLGKPGGGSYAELERRALTLDPLHLKTRDEAIFVSAHEGAHIADTATWKQLGYSDKALTSLAVRLGFFALHNVIEDGAINDRFNRDLPKLRPSTLASYERVDPAKPLGAIDHPEVKRNIEMLGFVPRYAAGLAAILTDWSELRHRLGFGQAIERYVAEPYRGGTTDDPEILAFISSSLKNSRRAISKIYAPNATAEEKLKASKIRTEWCDRIIYPELQKLFEADLEESCKCQLEKAIKEALEKRKGNKSQNGQPGQGEPQEGEPGEGEGEGQEQGRAMAPSSKAKGRKMDAETEDGGSIDGDEEDFSEEAKKNGRKGQEEDLDPHDLSEEEMEELDLPSPAEIERRAMEDLAKFDDALRDALKSIFEKSDLPGAKEVIEKLNKEAREKEAREKAEMEFQKGGKSLRENVIRNLSPYQQFYHDVADHIDAAYSRLSNIFIPNSHFAWKKNNASGAKIDMIRAMQYGATKTGLENLFMRRIDPKRSDIKVIVLVDRSGSMSGEKIIQATRAAVFARELFDRLKVDTACYSFAETPTVMIDFKENSGDLVAQQRFIDALRADGGTRDAVALAFANEKLKMNHARRAAIVVISDADSGEGEALGSVVRVIERRGIPVIHFGIGSNTSDDNGYYTQSFGDLEMYGSGENAFLDVYCREMEILARRLY